MTWDEVRHHRRWTNTSLVLAVAAVVCGVVGVTARQEHNNNLKEGR